MKRLFKFSLIALAMIVFFGGTYFLGFYSGKRDQWKVEALESGLEAREIMMHLRTLRDDRADITIRVLEHSLDSTIVLYGQVADSDEPIWDPFNTAIHARTAMESVAEFRKKYPSLSQDADTKKKAEETLSRLVENE